MLPASSQCLGRGDFAVHKSHHAQACNPIATEANTWFHVLLHLPCPDFTKITQRTVFQPNNFHSLPTFQTVNKSFSIK